MTNIKTQEKIIEENEHMKATLNKRKSGNMDILEIRVWDKIKKNHVYFKINTFFDESIKGVSCHMEY